jgi:hypothetical protein
MDKFFIKKTFGWGPNVFWKVYNYKNRPVHFNKEEIILSTLRNRTNTWISQNIVHLLSNIDSTIRFKIEGFADEPEVYISLMDQGLEFGYIGVRWKDSHTPVPVKIKKHFLSVTDYLSIRDHTSQMTDLLLKTIQSRKRQYRTCKFCERKVSREHRFDANTCHNCASVHYGVKY